MRHLSHRDDAPKHHWLENLRLIAGGGIAGVALLGLFTKDVSNSLSIEVIAAAVGAVLTVIALRVVGDL